MGGAWGILAVLRICPGLPAQQDVNWASARLHVVDKQPGFRGQSADMRSAARAARHGIGRITLASDCAEVPRPSVTNAGLMAIACSVNPKATQALWLRATASDALGRHTKAACDCHAGSQGDAFCPSALACVRARAPKAASRRATHAADPC